MPPESGPGNLNTVRGINDRSEYVHTLSGGQLIRDTLAKKGLATGFAGASLQLVPKRIIVRDQIPRPKYPGTRWVEMACLQEWDADRRQAAHAEKSLAVRELVRLSLRVQSTGVVAELHLDTALVATSGSGADHERRIRRGCQATDGRADNWRGVLNNARACSTAARRSLRPRLLYALCHSPPHFLKRH